MSKESANSRRKRTHRGGLGHYVRRDRRQGPEPGFSGGGAERRQEWAWGKTRADARELELRVQGSRRNGYEAQDFKSANPTLKTPGGTVAIDAYATNGNALVKSLRGLGATKVTQVGPLVSARVPVASLDKIGALATLKFARPRSPANAQSCRRATSR
jgi:hypothetical protein